MKPLRVVALLALMVALAGGTSRAQMTTGTYVGDGTAGRKITGLGFRPDVVLIKGEESDPAFTPTSTIIRTSSMVGDSSKPMVLDNALVANEVQSLDVDGFTVGSARRVNQTGINFYWVAWKSDADLQVGTYTGNGGSQSITGLAFSPEYVIVMSSSNRRAIQATTAAPVGRSFEFESAAWLANQITSLDANGFSVNHNAGAPYANENGVVYHYVAWNEAPLKTKVGSYQGNNTDNRNIGLVGFLPEYLLVKAIYNNNTLPAFTPPPVQRMAQMAGDASMNFSNGVFANNHVQAFQTDGFQIGNALSINRTYTDCNVDGPGCEYFYVAFNLVCPDCPPLGTTEDQGAGTLTVTAPNSFEMVFTTAGSGGIQIFYDLAEDPGRTVDLVSGSGDKQSMFFDALNAGGQYASYGPNSGTMDLLEATPTRVRVRNEAFYKRLFTEGSDLRAGLKGFGDTSIYPSGRLAWRWNRRTTSAVSYSTSDLNLNIHRVNSSPLNTWTAYSQTGDLASVTNPGTDDFMLAKLDAANGRTDFLVVIDKPWTVANGHQADSTNTDYHPSGFFINQWALFQWEQNPAVPPFTIPADSSEVWNFLTYFKPTNLGNIGSPWLDPEVLSRRDDYRFPDALSVTVGGGWFDADENTSSPSDFYNESEAAYTLTLDAASGLAFDIDGATTTRHKPFLKIRQWRSLQDPTSVTLNGSPLTNDTDYRADVKPISRAHFAQDVLWHSTLQDQASVDATPDVGSAGTVAGTATAVAAKYGQGFLFDAAGEQITFPSAGNFNLSQGSLDFWYQPRYAHTNSVRHVLWQNFGDATHYFLLEKTSANELKFTIQNGAAATTVTITSANYSWRDRDWVPLRVSWDAAAAAGLQARLFVRGNEPTHADAGTYNTAGMLVGTNYVGSDSTGANNALGIIDELFVYDAPGGPKLLAYAGLTANANEYLANGTAGKNDPLPFAAVNGLRQGEHFYLGADAEFRGLNVGLATPGAGTSPVLQWQYWNGTAWANLTLAGDQTSHLTKTGTIYWTDPSDWAPYSIQGGPDLYYVRAYLASGDYSTQAPVEGLIKTDILLFQYCSDITAASQNFVFSLPIATAVDLASFTAAGGNGMVELSWQTGSESDNLGFHLYRSTSRDGAYERITASPIPGLGTSPDGATYRYQDADVTNGVTYFYRLEDIESSGETRLHGPVSATPSANVGGPPPESDTSSPAPEILFGDPSKVAFRLVEQGPRGAIWELATNGFYADPQPDGSVRLRIPGFIDSSEPGEEAVPVKRSWVEALAGRKVEVSSVRVDDVVSFTGLDLAPPEIGEVRVSRDGTPRVISTFRRRAGARASWFPGEWARLVETGFQGDVKKALIELAPLRWDASSGELQLAKRISVRLAFTGREPAERSQGGAHGRRHRESSRHRSGSVIARLSTREPGLYGVSFEELFRSGRRLRDVSSLRLSRLGKTEALHVEPQTGHIGPGSTLYFVSEGASLNPYGGEAVYELEIGSRGVSMPIVSSEPPREAVTGFHWSRRELEQNRYYQAMLLDAPDRWLWDVLFAPMTKSYPFELEGLSPVAQSSTLEVWLQGTSDTPGSPDHHLRIFVNGSLVAESRFDGKQAIRIAAEVAPGLLRDGRNDLAVENVGDTGASYSVVMLDRFAVTFPRLSTIAEGMFEARFREPVVAEFSGPGAHVVDLTEAPARWLSGLETAGAPLRFRAEAGGRYLLARPEAVLHPEIRRPVPSRLKNTRNRFDYLVIGPRELLRSAEPLLELRSSQGLRSLAAPLEEVTSEFGHGEQGPDAVQEFLSYSYHHWTSPPRYVLLLGDATYDYKGYLGPVPSHQVPSLLVRTSYLWTASDPALASVNGEDGLPDLAIGRLPARTPEEARILVNKILAYGRAAPVPRDPVVLVADNPDRAGNFVSHAEEIASDLLSGRAVEKIYLSQLGPEATRIAIADSFDRGAFLMSYVGHGGIHLWADENVFDIARVGSLVPQNRQPLLLTMNCLNGYFHFPYFNSLSEELLKAEGRGVIAAFSPSGMSLDAEAHLYHRALIAEIFQGNHLRLGDAILAAQETYAGTGALPELLSIYHLLGDPALELR